MKALLLQRHCILHFLLSGMQKHTPQALYAKEEA
jgi:hypothetical protein